MLYTYSINVNSPSGIIKRWEDGTPNLDKRVNALTEVAKAGYPMGLIIAPVGSRTMANCWTAYLSDWGKSLT